MINVRIISSKLANPVEKEFESLDLANKWIEKHTKLGSWGLPDTWVDVQTKEECTNYDLCREIVRETLVSGKIVEKEVIYSCLKKGDFTTEITTILYDDTELKLSQYREKRDKLLAKSDKYMLSDYPIQAKLRQLIKDYREYLRNCTDTIKSVPDLSKISIDTLKLMTFKEYIEFKHGDIVDSETRRAYKSFTGL
jgi:ADP-ribose pyrophosphatase YjhB (NUDIX family)